jgi:hypothetical protein
VRTTRHGTAEDDRIATCRIDSDKKVQQTPFPPFVKGGGGGFAVKWPKISLNPPFKKGDLEDRLTDENPYERLIYRLSAYGVRRPVSLKKSPPESFPHKSVHLF